VEYVECSCGHDQVEQKGGGGFSAAKLFIAGVCYSALKFVRSEQ
jgi:hypothetical protein